MTLYLKTDISLTGAYARRLPSIPLGAGGADHAWIGRDLTAPDGTALSSWTDSISGVTLTGTGDGAAVTTSQGLKAALFTKGTARLTGSLALPAEHTILLVVERAFGNAILWEGLNGTTGFRITQGPTTWSLSRVPNGNGYLESKLSSGSEVGGANIAIARIGGASPSLKVRGVDAGVSPSPLPNVSAATSTVKLGRDADLAQGAVIHLAAIWRRRLTDTELDDAIAKAKANFPFAIG